MKISGTGSDNIIRAIKADHSKYISCRRTKSGFMCSVNGNANDVRKTLNEFLESIVFLERVSESL